MSCSRQASTIFSLCPASSAREALVNKCLAVTCWKRNLKKSSSVGLGGKRASAGLSPIIITCCPSSLRSSPSSGFAIPVPQIPTGAGTIIRSRPACGHFDDSDIYFLVWGESSGRRQAAPQGETGLEATLRVIAQQQVGFVLLCQHPRDRQSESGTLGRTQAQRLEAYERFKHGIEFVGRNSGSMITNPDPQLVTFQRCGNFRGAAVFERVVQQVGQASLQSTGTSLDIVAAPAGQNRRLPALGGILHQALQKRIQRDRRERLVSLAAPGKLQAFADQPLHSAQVVHEPAAQGDVSDFLEAQPQPRQRCL